MSTWRKPYENHRNTKEQTIGQQQQRSNMKIIRKQKENHRKTMWTSQEKRSRVSRIPRIQKMPRIFRMPRISRIRTNPRKLQEKYRNLIRTQQEHKSETIGKQFENYKKTNEDLKKTI